METQSWKKRETQYKFVVDKQSWEGIYGTATSSLFNSEGGFRARQHIEDSIYGR